jgi:Ser/Thr protein kinase RdoA (MazF antagonist)
MTQAAHLAHGLAGDELAPDWAPLTPDEVRSLFDTFYPALAASPRILWRSPRPLSAAALVGTRAGTVFVKRHHVAVRTVMALEEEHRFAAHVRARGVPVPRIHRAAHGGSATRAGDWVYEVQDAARGVDAYRDAYSWAPVGSVRQAFAAGAMLGRLQRAAHGYVAPQRSTHVLVARAEILSALDPVAALDRQLAERPALAAYLAGTPWRHQLPAALDPWQPVAARGLAGVAPAWTHGDWHVSNLYWSGEGDDARVSDVLDFGLAAQTFPLFDLATAIERNAIAWLEMASGDIGRADLARALIDGYTSEQPLDAHERALLGHLMPVIHVDFALSEIEYFEGITRRRDHADVAYHDFLIGHAAWFATDHGKRFLDAIGCTN